ncbi:MAG: HNH endonuclease family protein [Pseudobdellovibrio sp.]
MKKSFLIYAIFISGLINSEFAFARVLPPGEFGSLGSSQENFDYPDYYQIKEDPRVAIVDLMNFDHVQAKLPLPTTPYNRAAQFGTWINYPGDQACLNTRAKVLVRESKTAVTYTPDGCAVQTGSWDEPYAGLKLSAPKDVQIDHFVPLKNAYMTGAFEWDQNKRCLYANYLGNAFHLLAVSGTQNLRKGDNSPAGYMPPNKNYSCQYLKQWLEVKVIWALRLTPKEIEGLQSEFSADGCDRANFKVTAADLAVQRRFMEDNKELCSQSQ